MDINEIWEKALFNINLTINSPVSYNIYIKDAIPVSYLNGVFTISVPMTINKNMIECRYKNLIEGAISDIVESRINLLVITNQELEENKGRISYAPPKDNTENLNKRYTFANFIIGASNEFATAAAIRAAEKPGNIYNPLFIYGNSGLGKTHLLHAIGNEIAINFPNYRIIYVTSEKFTNDFINSVRENSTEKFRQIYRQVDVLLIDDIQFFSKKEQTQEEFFHTFNELYNLNKQIVITSDRKPKDLTILEERLRTRCEQGLTIDISVPSFETRVAILQNKAVLKGVSIDEKVIFFIADKIQTNIRELEGALLNLISFAQISNEEINIDFAGRTLKSFLEDDAKRKFSSEKIKEKICSYYNITKEELIGKTKTKNVILPRQVAMYLCKNMTQMNYGEIAKEFGNRDRTTVLHNVEKIRVDIKTDDVLNKEIEYIMKDIKEN